MLSFFTLQTEIRVNHWKLCSKATCNHLVSQQQHTLTSGSPTFSSHLPSPHTFSACFSATLSSLLPHHSYLCLDCVFTLHTSLLTLSQLFFFSVSKKSSSGSLLYRTEKLNRCIVFWILTRRNSICIYNIGSIQSGHLIWQPCVQPYKNTVIGLMLSIPSAHYFC